MLKAVWNKEVVKINEVSEISQKDERFFIICRGGSYMDEVNNKLIAGVAAPVGSSSKQEIENIRTSILKMIEKHGYTFIERNVKSMIEVEEEEPID